MLTWCIQSKVRWNCLVHHFHTCQLPCRLRDDYMQYFGHRELRAFSVEPLLLFPTHFTGEPGYFSDTETSTIWDDEAVETDWDRDAGQTPAWAGNWGAWVSTCGFLVVYVETRLNSAGGDGDGPTQVKLHNKAIKKINNQLLVSSFPPPLCALCTAFWRWNTIWPQVFSLILWWNSMCKVNIMNWHFSTRILLKTQLIISVDTGRKWCVFKNLLTDRSGVFWGQEVIFAKYQDRQTNSVVSYR